MAALSGDGWKSGFGGPTTFGFEEYDFINNPSPGVTYFVTVFRCETAGCGARLYRCEPDGLIVCRECGRAAILPLHGGQGCIA